MFHREPIKFYHSVRLEHHVSSPEWKANPIREYLVHGITYNICPNGLPAHLWERKIAAPLMVIRNVIQYKVINWKMFILQSYTRRHLYVHSVYGEVKETFLLHRIKFPFNFQGVKLTIILFSVRLSFPVMVHKTQGQTLHKVLVALKSKSSSIVQLYVYFSRVRTSEDVFLCHKIEDTTSDAQLIYPIPVAVSK